MNHIYQKFKNLPKAVKWSILTVALFIVVGGIIVGVGFGLHIDDSKPIENSQSEITSSMVDSEVTSDITVSSELTESSSVMLDSDLTLYSGYWYNSEDTESYEFKFTAIDAAHGEFSLGIFRLGTLYGNCELTSNNVAVFSSDSGISGTLTFNTYSIEVIINNPNQYWPSYILLDQSNGSSPLVINAPEVDYNDPAYVPEDAYGPNGEKYAADAADIPQPTVVCPQCGTKFFDTASFVGDVCYQCYQANQPTYCSACWNPVTDESHGGYCESCWNKVQQGLTPGPDPNVWCPDCGTGYFVTGVGNDGIYCKVCQKNFMP